MTNKNTMLVLTRNEMDVMTMPTGENSMGMYTGSRNYATRDEIAQLAYHIYETRGRQNGCDIEDARRPWIMPSGASADEIAAVIAKCPSGALHFTQLNGGATEASPENNTIEPTPRGPLCVRGRVLLRSANGSLIVRDTRLTLCRCGQSHNKPSCDNSHCAAGFDDPGVVADGGEPPATDDGLSITASLNGPLLAEGAFLLRGAGGHGQYQATDGELCRCGGSGNKPFCDGTHQRIGFRSEES